jgi:hypothetical protein
MGSPTCCSACSRCSAIKREQDKSELSVGARDDQANPCSAARKHDAPLLDVEDHRAAD